MVRILVAIPHYYSFSPENQAGGSEHSSSTSEPQIRKACLQKVITSLHHPFNRPQCMIDIAAKTTSPVNKSINSDLEIVICTTGGSHLLNQLDLHENYYEQIETDAEPFYLGYECHRVLRERLGGYEFYCYLEDDLVLHDPWFFQKLRWLNSQTEDACLFQPHRYEVKPNHFVHKAYIDGEIREQVTSRIRQIDRQVRIELEYCGTQLTFNPPLNPHSGCFFLNAHQMARWASQPCFLDRSQAFIGPLESAATLGVFRSFLILKPEKACASFLEIEHADTRFINVIRA